MATALFAGPLRSGGQQRGREVLVGVWAVAVAYVSHRVARHWPAQAGLAIDGAAGAAARAPCSRSSSSSCSVSSRFPRSRASGCASRSRSFRGRGPPRATRRRLRGAPRTATGCGPAFLLPVVIQEAAGSRSRRFTSSVRPPRSSTRPTFSGAGRQLLLAPGGVARAEPGAGPGALLVFQRSGEFTN